MSNQVYANMMEVSCKAASGKSICAFPDVCFTPPQTPATPPGVPIPYPNTGMASDCTDGSSTVKISGQEVMLKNKSYFKKSTGDEAGCAPKKGVVTSKNMGKVYFKAWSMDVKVEGENVVRHLDITTHNHASEGPNTPPIPNTDAMATAPDQDCGGPHRKTSKPVNDGKDSHHCPAKDSYKHTSLSKDDGPAIKMDPADHRRTASNGATPGSDAYRAKQKALIDQGKFSEAMEMDVKDIKEKFPGKYDHCLDQMLEYAKTLDMNLLKPTA